MKDKTSSSAVENATSAKSSAFTPGPWQFDRDNLGINTLEAYGLLNANGEPLHVSVHTRFGGAFRASQRRPEGEAEADARLIAAAPDLLSALRRVLGELMELPGDDVQSDPWLPRELGDVTRAAIAKATKG